MEARPRVGGAAVSGDVSADDVERVDDRRAASPEHQADGESTERPEEITALAVVLVPFTQCRTECDHEHHNVRPILNPPFESHHLVRECGHHYVGSLAQQLDL